MTGKDVRKIRATLRDYRREGVTESYLGDSSATFPQVIHTGLGIIFSAFFVANFGGGSNRSAGDFLVVDKTLQMGRSTEVDSECDEHVTVVYLWLHSARGGHGGGGGGARSGPFAVFADEGN